MRISQVFFIPFFLIFFLIFTSSMVTSRDNCSYSRCNDRVRVQFPFSLEDDDQQESCGYPGFNLTCNIINKSVVIKLGSWGEFLVRDIDYATQEVTLNDQDHCLAKRLMNMNLTGSPLKAAFYETFHFFNCPLNVSFSFMEPVTCLSTSNYSVFAVPSMSGGRYVFNSCEFITTVMVPTPAPSWEAYYEYGYQAQINDDLHLVWLTPNCAECDQRGGKCGFKNSKSSDIRCFDLPRRGLPKAVKYVLSIGVGIPTLLCVILIACYICGRCKSFNGNNHHFRHRNFESSSSVMPQAPIFVVGLDEAVIQSYPKTVLGESRRLAKPDDNTCSICLSEYQAKDTLKTIPSCKHCFHADCIDEWLRRNVTCPLCRNASMPIPLPPPLAAP